MARRTVLRKLFLTTFALTKRLCNTKCSHGFELGCRASAGNPHANGTVGPLPPCPCPHYDLQWHYWDCRRFFGMVSKDRFDPGFHWFLGSRSNACIGRLFSFGSAAS